MQVNVAKRPYNHCRYAGNNGDVWKHLLLVEVLRTLATRNPKSFHYVETHAGPGYARLGENGDWRRGIGRFMNGAGTRTSHPYFDLVLPAMQENLLYKGSWVLATEFLRNVGHTNFKVSAHEINADTLKMAASAIRKGQLSTWVGLHPKSGYDALQKLDHADFVLIDPPYRSSDGTADDWERVHAAVQRVKQICKNWMVWYPIFRRDEPDELIAMSGGMGLELSWAPDAPGWVMKGCGMLMDTDTADLLRFQPGMLKGLAESLGGQMSMRVAAPLSAAAEAKPAQELAAPHQGATGGASTYAEFLSKPIQFVQRGMMVQEPSPGILPR